MGSFSLRATVRWRGAHVGGRWASVPCSSAAFPAHFPHVPHPPASLMTVAAGASGTALPQPSPLKRAARRDWSCGGGACVSSREYKPLASVSAARGSSLARDAGGRRSKEPSLAAGRRRLRAGCAWEPSGCDEVGKACRHGTPPPPAGGGGATMASRPQVAATPAPQTK